MTLQKTQKTTKERTPWGYLCLVFILLFSLALLLRRADVAADCMRKGLSLCARAIVPSLFPFLVLSELLVASGAGERLFLPLTRPLGKILGLSRAGCSAVALGLLCGFPVGARCAILAYEKNTITRAECERAISASSIPSSAFLISTVGAMLWKDKSLGIFLYVCAIVSALLSGILIYAVQKRKQKGEKSTYALQPPPIRFDASMFTSSVRNATVSTLLICAYVVFFSTLTGAVGLILGRFGVNETISAILSALLELSSGTVTASMLSNRYLAILLTAAAVGWSGISVHCQMLSVCEGHRLSVRPYFAAKLIQALLCPLLISAVFLFDICICT